MGMGKKWGKMGLDTPQMVHVNSKHVKKVILPIDMTADVNRQKARESKVSLRNMTVTKSHNDLVTVMNMRPINDEL